MKGWGHSQGAGRQGIVVSGRVCACRRSVGGWWWLPCQRGGLEDRPRGETWAAVAHAATVLLNVYIMSPAFTAELRSACAVVINLYSSPVPFISVRV